MLQTPAATPELVGLGSRWDRFPSVQYTPMQVRLRHAGGLVCALEAKGNNRNSHRKTREKAGKRDFLI